MMLVSNDHTLLFLCYIYFATIYNILACRAPTENRASQCEQTEVFGCFASCDYTENRVETKDGHVISAVTHTHF